MTPNSPNEAVFVLLVVSVMACISLPLILFEMAETKRRRMRMKQQHEQRTQDRAEMFLQMWQHEAIRREQLERIVAAQAANQSPVSVPVTHCERRERRRRFLPLEDSSNAAR
jgi:hypothetical protein